MNTRAKHKNSLLPSRMGQDQGQPSVVVLPKRDATREEPSLGSISLRLLESPHVFTNNQRLDLTPQKPILLLLYLAMKHDWVTRDELGVVFYPEDDETSARHNLRVLINRAKAVKWSGGLEAEQHRLRWLVPSDVLTVREGVANRDWEAVLRLHQQPLLSGFTFESSPGFEAWLEMEREALLNLWRKAGLEHALELSKNAKHSVATEVLGRLLQQDTLAEDTLAFYLEQAYLSGKRDEALKTYERFKATLKSELGLEPLESTEQLANTIRRSASLTVTVTQTQTESRPIPLSVRRPPKLVAREVEQEQLLNSHTPITLILGEPGVGKTRLLQETLPDALWLRCLEGLAVPYYPLLELIRANISRLPDLAYYRDDLARLLPELSSNHTPVALEPSVAKTRLLEALAFVLESLGQPLALDDLQWCDAATLEVFIFLASRRRVRLYATCRKGELDTPLQSTLGTLRGQDLLTEIELHPFDQQAIRQLLADLAGISEGPQKFSGWLFARSSGNVLFALETLKNLFEQGILQERDGNWHSDLDGITQDYSELSVPPKVAELIERRLKSLPPETQRVVQAASVMREGFTPNLLAQLVGLSELATLEGLEQAEESGLIKGEQFSHDLFRQSIYNTVPQSRRALQHTMLAELLQAEPLLSAHHWRQVGNLERAWQLELGVARTQLERGLLNSGLAMFEAIIQEAPKEHPCRLEALVVAGNYLFLQDTGRTEAYLNEVLNTPELEPRLQLRALLALVNNAVYQGDMTKAQQVITEAEALTNQALEPKLRLDLEHQQLEVMLRSGEFAKAEAHLPNVYALDEHDVDTQSYEAQLRFYQARFVEAAALFEKMRQQDPTCVKRLTLENDLGACYWMLGKLIEAEKELLGSLETWRGSLHVEALSTMHLAFVRFSQGKAQEAIELAERAIHYSQKLGSLTFEADARQRLGVIHFQSGQLAKAREILEVAAKQMREVRDPYRMSQSSSLLANIYTLLGDTIKAEELLQEAETLLTFTPNPFVYAFANHAKALLALHRHDPEMASRHFETVEAFTRNHQNPEFLCMVLLARARLEPQPEKLLKEALKVSREGGFRLQEYLALVQLGDESAGEVLEFLRANAPEGWF